MKHKIILKAIALILTFSSGMQAQEREYDYMFFENSALSGNYFFSSVKYNEGAYVKNIANKLPVNDKTFFTPPNSLELDYTNGCGTWTSTIDFERIRGNDYFKKSNSLSFWMMTENGKDELLPMLQIGLVEKERKTKKIVSNKQSGKVEISKYITDTDIKGWRQIIIPLKAFGALEKYPNQLVFSNSAIKGEKRVFIDQIELLPEDVDGKLDAPQNISVKAYERHVDLMWKPVDNAFVKYIKIYRSADNKTFIPIGIQRPYFHRYTDFTGQPDKTYYYKISHVAMDYSETSVSASHKATSYHMTDEQLLDMVQEASFRYYWEGAETNSGLALENIPGRKNMIATGASGFGIMAIIVGVERGFILREQAVERMLTITSFLEQCDKFHGAVSHFMDGTNGKVEPFFGDKDNGGDLVETSFLFQGLLAARQYFDKKDSEERQIRETISGLWEAVEWDWYDREKENKYLTWHWSPDKEWLINHKLIGWNETMITYLLAMASPTHPISSSMYYNGWASQEEQAVKYRKDWGKTDDGSFYSNDNYYHGIKLPVGVSNGGPLFFIHYSYLGLDPNGVTDKYTNYFENNRNIALINWRYCSENPMNHKGMGHSFWGLTASDGPWGYNAIEPTRERDNGTLAPTGALASFPYTPEQSMAALKNMYRNHGQYLWGEYGFKDAVNLQENWMAKIYMGLNQAPVTIMIENYRTGLIWKLFMQNKEISEALAKLKDLKH